MRHLRLIPTNEFSKSPRIAFTSRDRKGVDQHFGAAEVFVIYALAPGEARLLEVMSFRDDDDGSRSHDDKLAARIARLDGCVAVYCNAVGASAVKRLLAAGIQPIKVPFGTSVDGLLGDLHRELSGTPPAWLTRGLTTKAAGRFDAMEAEGWTE